GGHDGLYGPGDVTWRVNRETVLLAGGGRALLLQVAHPLVAAGVAEHSDYREDPWRRLYRTLDVTTRIVFGDGETSREAARRLRREYGLAWDPARAALLRASTATIRRLLPLLPGLLREFPAARAASRRAA